MNRWHNTKEGRLRLSKCKAYEKTKSNTAKSLHYDLLNISSFSSEFDSSDQKQIGGVLKKAVLKSLVKFTGKQVFLRPAGKLW